MPRLFAPSTFRLSLVAMPLHLVAGLLVLAFVYFSAISLVEHRVDHAIAAETERLSHALRQAGPEQVYDTFARRIDEERGSARLYALRTAGGTVTVANFQLPPQELPAPGQTVSTTVKRTDGTVEARLHAVVLADGDTAIIGRDLAEQNDFRQVIHQSLALALAATLALSVAAGLITSRAVLRRLGAINLTASRILSGHLEERVPIRGGDDEFAHLAGNINAMLDRIAQLMQATREVADNIAHDLRSPLNRMRARLELALLPGSGGDEKAEAIAASLTDADDLLETFEALLTIARLDHGAAPNFAPVELSALIDDLADYYAPLAEERTLTLRAESTAPVEITADRHLLFQALSNAVDNAIRYSDPGGAIVVSLCGDSDTAEIAVADHGPGIPADRREDVLRRFVRLDHSRPRPGTGLGLSVMAAVVRHHGGELILQDNHPGLRLVIRLPQRHTPR